jgi:hypothetical protein
MRAPGATHAASQVSGARPNRCRGDEPVAAEYSPKIIRMLAGADDLYFDEIKQIKIPQFSSGRVA